MKDGQNVKTLYHAKIELKAITEMASTDAFTPYKVETSVEEARGFDTRQIHSGAKPDPTTKARAVPIYATAVSRSVF